MRKKYRSKDIFEELDTKKQTPIYAIIIFLSIVTILSVATFIIISAIEEHTNITLPWSEEEKEKPSKKPSTSSRDEMELMPPTISEGTNRIEENGCALEIKEITADSKGFLVTVSLLSKTEFCTVRSNHILVDGFYVSSDFSVSDIKDRGTDWVTKQEPAEVQFRIKKTELDELDMFGFSRLSIYFDLETDENKSFNMFAVFIFNNDIKIVNERKSLIPIDEKNNVEVSYYKVVNASDATYIYFDFKNKAKSDIMVYIKNLKINSKVYDASKFKEISYEGSQRALYIRIPKEDVSSVQTIDVSFMLVEEVDKNVESIYVTTNYSRVL